jgi:hypothetical protein
MPDTIETPKELEADLTVGGPVDKFRVTLAIYHADLDPSEVTHIMGCEPTGSQRRGDRRSEKSAVLPVGGWFLTKEATAPSTPNDAITSLLSIPHPNIPWKELAQRFKIQIRIGIHTGGWNRGFELSPAVVAILAGTAAPISFDLYMYGDDDEA